MATTYTLIASTTLSSAQSSISFTSIPSTYTDLIVKVSGRLTRATTGGAVVVAFNGSTSSFSIRSLYGAGSATGSGTTPSNFVGYWDGANETANTFSNFEMYIPNYSSSNNKSFSVDVVDENNATEAYATMVAGLWANSTAINSIAFTDNSAGNFAQYSTAYLYGIKNS